jgi:hypothetical protein
MSCISVVVHIYNHSKLKHEAMSSLIIQKDITERETPTVETVHQGLQRKSFCSAGKKIGV